MPYFSIESPQVLTEFPKHDWETSEDYPTAYELKAVWLCGGRGSKNPKDRGNRRGQWLTHFILETPLKISYLLTSCYHSLSPRVWLTRVLSLEGICHGQGAPPQAHGVNDSLFQAKDISGAYVYCYKPLSNSICWDHHIIIATGSYWCFCLLDSTLVCSNVLPTTLWS